MKFGDSQSKCSDELAKSKRPVSGFENMQEYRLLRVAGVDSAVGINGRGVASGNGGRDLRPRDVLGVCKGMCRRWSLVARVLILAVALCGGSVRCPRRILILLGGVFLLRLGAIMHGAIGIRVRARGNHSSSTSEVVSAVIVVARRGPHRGFLVFLEVFLLVLLALTSTTLHDFHHYKDDDQEPNDTGNGRNSSNSTLVRKEAARGVRGGSTSRARCGG